MGRSVNDPDEIPTINTVLSENKNKQKSERPVQIEFLKILLLFNNSFNTQYGAKITKNSKIQFEQGVVIFVYFYFHSKVKY
jgi:hypothetical protein